MIHQVSLSGRVAAVLVISSIATILAVMLTAYKGLNEDFEATLIREQAYLAQQVSDRVNRELESRLDLLQAFSTSLTDGKKLLPTAQINALLNRQTRVAERFSNSLIVLNEQATAIAENVYVPNRIGTNYADRAHFKAAIETRQAVISRPLIGRTTGVPLLSFAAPIESDEGDLLGLVSGSIDLDKTSLIPAEIIEEERKNESLFLVIDTGNFLYVEGPQDQTGVTPLPDPGVDPLIDAAMSGIGIGEVILSDKSRLVYAASHLQRLGWLFIRAVPKEQAEAPARESFQRFLAFTVLLMLLIVPLAYFITRSAMDPLSRMTFRIRRMTTGETTATRLEESGPPEVQNLAIAFNHLLDERDSVSRMKDEFVSNVSHELRTPLTSMNGALKLLAAGTVGDLPPKARDLSHLAMRNGERLQLLISDLLDFNKLTAGELRVDMRPQLLEPIISLAVMGNRTMAHNVDVELEGDCPSALMVDTDAHRLRQILDNFISNAIKFSPPGGVVRLRVEPPENDMVRLVVSDQGAGIPEHFRARLFERFAQAEVGTDRAHRGTGLGLAICRELAVLLKCHIGVYNDEGAHFWLEVPVVQSSSARPNVNIDSVQSE